MDDYAFLLFDEQLARQAQDATLAEDEEPGFTTQDLFIDEVEEDAYIPPGSTKKTAKQKGKQKAVDPPSSTNKRANNTLNENDLHLLNEDDYQPFIDPNDMSAQQDYAALMGDGPLEVSHMPSLC